MLWKSTSCNERRFPSPLSTEKSLIVKRLGIGSADLLITATGICIDATLLTLNINHFPMFPALRRPY